MLMTAVNARRRPGEAQEAAVLYHPQDGLPFTFAGLWERWKDGMLSFTILTTEGGPVTRHLHDRMPVILDEFGFFGWLEHGWVARPEDLDAKIQLFPVSPKVNSPKYDEPDCIAPFAEA